MIITLTEANSIYTVISKFNEQKLPIKLSYKIMKILSNLEGELQFYRTQLQDLLKDCAQIDEQGNLIYSDESQENFLLKSDKIEEFHNRYDELANMDIELDDYFLTLEELENLELSPKDLYGIQPLILEEESEEEVEEE